MGKSVAKLQQMVADSDDLPDEEDSSSNTDAAKLKKSPPMLEEDYLHDPCAMAMRCSLRAAQALLLHRADHLPILFKGEVTTPPPDRY